MTCNLPALKPSQAFAALDFDFFVGRLLEDTVNGSIARGNALEYLAELQCDSNVACAAVASVVDLLEGYHKNNLASATETMGKILGQLLLHLEPSHVAIMFDKTLSDLEAEERGKGQEELLEKKADKAMQKKVEKEHGDCKPGGSRNDEGLAKLSGMKGMPEVTESRGGAGMQFSEVATQNRRRASSRATVTREQVKKINDELDSQAWSK